MKVVGGGGWHDAASVTYCSLSCNARDVLASFVCMVNDSDCWLSAVQAIKAKILERVDSVTSDTAATSGDEQVSRYVVVT